MVVLAMFNWFETIMVWNRALLLQQLQLGMSLLDLGVRSLFGIRQAFKRRAYGKEVCN